MRVFGSPMAYARERLVPDGIEKIFALMPLKLTSNKLIICCPIVTLREVWSELTVKGANPVNTPTPISNRADRLTELAQTIGRRAFVGVVYRHLCGVNLTVS